MEDLGFLLVEKARRVNSASGFSQHCPQPRAPVLTSLLTGKLLYLPDLSFLTCKMEVMVPAVQSS